MIVLVYCILSLFNCSGGCGGCGGRGHGRRRRRCCYRRRAFQPLCYEQLQKLVKKVSFFYWMTRYKWCDVYSGWSGAGITRRASNPADLHRGVGLRRPEGTPGRRRN